MNLTPEQQKQRDELLADMDKMRQRIESFCAPEPVKSEWPQPGDKYYTIGIAGVIYGYLSSGSDYILSRANGNCFKTEAEAKRHVEAMKVQAELRRMPGVFAPPPTFSRSSEKPYGFCIFYNDIRFKAACYEWGNYSTLAIGGVWFDTLVNAERAITMIGQDRLAIFRDDYLQVPIGGDV